jgi:hypothetical protein
MKNTIVTLPKSPHLQKKNVERSKINTLYTQIDDLPGFEQALQLKVAG